MWLKTMTLQCAAHEYKCFIDWYYSSLLFKKYYQNYNKTDDI